METKKCPFCGAELSEEDTTCSSCNKDLYGDNISDNDSQPDNPEDKITFIRMMKSLFCGLFFDALMFGYFYSVFVLCKKYLPETYDIVSLLIMLLPQLIYVPVLLKKKTDYLTDSIFFSVMIFSSFYFLFIYCSDCILGYSQAACASVSGAFGILCGLMGCIRTYNKAKKTVKFVLSIVGNFLLLIAFGTYDSLLMYNTGISTLTLVYFILFILTLIHIGKILKDNNRNITRTSINIEKFLLITYCIFFVIAMFMEYLYYYILISPIMISILGLLVYYLYKYKKLKN